MIPSIVEDIGDNNVIEIAYGNYYQTVTSLIEGYVYFIDQNENIVTLVVNFCRSDITLFLKI